jgi:hypothetical protein
LGPLGTAATHGPVVPAPGDYDDGEIGGMKIDMGNRSTRRKPAPVPLCPPQHPTRTRAAAVGSQRGPHGHSIIFIKVVKPYIYIYIYIYIYR